MTTANLSKRVIHFYLVALSILLISACTGVGQDKKGAPTLFTEFYETAEYLLQKAEEVKEPQNTEWQLAAIQALTKESKYVLADSVIEYLQNKTLNTQQKNHLLLLIADNQYAQNQLDDTMETLKRVDPELVSVPAKLHYLKLKTELHVRNKEHQAAVDTLFELTPLLTVSKQKQQYNDLMLSELNMLDPSVLNQFNSTPVNNNKSATSAPVSDVTKGNAFDSELAAIEAELNARQTNNTNETPLTDEQAFVQGWYSLASIYHRYQLRTNQLLRGVEAWKLLYPAHPVIDYMPSQLKNIPEASPYQPTKIAVLLPLTGRFKKPAQAIQYGISYAFYNQADDKKRQQEEQDAGYDTSLVNSAGDAQNISSARSDRDYIATPPHMLFLDTNKMSMQEIADQLHSQHIGFVIGPLLKPNVEVLLPLVKDIPVLALNGFPADQRTSSIHYAFPLSPEGEAEQAAEVIFQNKHKKPLLLAPNSDFGRRTAAAFEARWKSLSEAQQATDETVESYPAETHYFSKDSDYGKFLASALHTDQSKERISQMQGMLGRKLEAEARSRRDVDAIYIISKRSELLFIKPFLSVTISPFAENIPLYASSRSHSADITNTQDKELTGLTFSDVNFLINDESQMNEKIQAIWPKQRLGTLRLFALGYDSYNLIEQLKPLQVIEGYKFPGLVGELTLDASNTVESKLSWATYEDGNLVEVTSPLSSQ
ncbi:penicillin-binding protein activator [Psychromonas sp. 14N.309.X.WAT.B.A12]|uniref:penicillin-binding protein activator n=1 Tax=unclassified Psychromonas TaxID=2614957 RepID=UPI0025B1F9A5|nr:penicillin-binding protein activator [Psychromonas sp. 14N.309.X.WAT.B.A12]MDN2663633.1 penicillin-binding protein activator [Psychromonas sp. 14N.309.X.WAT.B.A12]